MSIEAMKQALDALEKTLETLDDENAKPGGAIADTIWYSEHETLFDYLESQITSLRTAIAKAEKQESVAMKRRLVKIHDALSNELGDTDPHIDEDMTDDEICEEMPVFWAAKEIADLIGDAPWTDYTAPPQRHDLQAKGERPAPCVRHCEANAYEVVIRGLKARLAEAEQPAQQEPVAYRSRLASGSYTYCHSALLFDNAEPLYTHPPQRHPITDEEALDIARTFGAQPWQPGSCLAFARAIEAKHGIKEKNCAN